MQEKEGIISAAAADTGTGQITGEPSAQKAEDMVNKFAMQFFSREMLQYLGISGKAVRHMPTEQVHLEWKHVYEDFNFEMDDGSCCHLEFESDLIRTEDLRRFRTYEAIASQTYRLPVITYVVCSAAVKRQRSSITEGINTYRVRLIRLKSKSADRVLSRLERKRSEEMTMGDLVPAALVLLLGGMSSPLERAKRAMRVLQKPYEKVPKESLRQLQAALMMLAGKILSPEEMKKLKEGLGMMEIVRIAVEEAKRQIFQEGVEEGVQQGVQQGIHLVTR